MPIPTQVINKSNIPIINQEEKNASKTDSKIFTFKDQYIPSLDKLDQSSFLDSGNNFLIDFINKLLDDKTSNDLHKLINLYEERYRDFKCVADEDQSVWLDEQSWLQDQSWYPQDKSWYSNNKNLSKYISLLMIKCFNDCVDKLMEADGEDYFKRQVKDSDMEAVKEVVSAHGLSEEFQDFLNLKTPATIEDLINGARFALHASGYRIEEQIEDAIFDLKSLTFYLKDSYFDNLEEKDPIYLYYVKKWDEKYMLPLDTFDMRMFASIDIFTKFRQDVFDKLCTKESFMKDLLADMKDILSERMSSLDIDYILNQPLGRFTQEELQAWSNDYDIGVNLEELDCSQYTIKDLFELLNNNKEIGGGSPWKTTLYLKSILNKFIQEKTLNTHQVQCIHRVLSQLEKTSKMMCLVFSTYNKSIHQEMSNSSSSRDLVSERIEDAFNNRIVPKIMHDIYTDISAGEDVVFPILIQHLIGVRVFKRDDDYVIELANAGAGLRIQDPDAQAQAAKIFVEYTTQDPDILMQHLRALFINTYVCPYPDLSFKTEYAEKLYQSLRENMQENLLPILKPWQKVGNCFYRNFLESVMRMIEHQEDLELVNELYAFLEDELQQQQAYPALQDQLNELSLPKFNYDNSSVHIDLVA